METPLPYLPIDRRLALAHNRALPERAQGAALFADISGFTPLTEMLARVLGPKRGAEELTVYLNQVYDTLITELHRFGGSALVFSGDAITCWFDENDEHGQPREGADNAPAQRALASALAMQVAMTRFAHIQIPSGGMVSLGMKTAVAAGPVRRFVVGDPTYMLLDVMAGQTLERLAEAEHHAEKGEVILDDETATRLGAAVQISHWRVDEATHARFAVVTGLAAPVAETPWPALAPEALSDEAVRAWLLPPVYRRLSAGRGEYLAELRPVAALFLRFTGIDYDHNPAAPDQLNAFIQRVEQVLLRYDGSLLQLTIGDKGSYLYAAFGAPNAHEDDVARAATAALELVRLPDALAFLEPMQIGLTYGRMRAGAYGGQQRRTYGVLGDAVNLAARLMQAAQPGHILVSDEAQAHIRNSFAWETLPAIRVKGKSEPVGINRLLSAKAHDAIQLLEALYPLPPVGRVDTLASLTQALTHTQTGSGQMVRLRGDAGMGKTHLLAQFLRQMPEGVRVVIGTAQSLTRTTPYHPWRQIFTTLLELDGLTEAEAIAHLTAHLKAEHPEWLLRLPLLGDVLNLPIPNNATTAALDANTRQKTLFALLIEMTQTWAQAQPVLVILENAHWLDEASLALTQTWAQQATSTTSVMLVVVQRPPWVGEPPVLPQLAALPHYTELVLSELLPAEAGLLIERGLGEPAAPLLLAIIEAIAHGNPFFIGELLAAMRHAKQLTLEAGQWRLADDLLSLLQAANFISQVQGEWQLKSGADLSTVKLGIPDSIHGLILSRLDQLSEAHKLTLKVSSVVGHYIDLALVAEAHPEEKDVAEIQAEARDMEAEEVIHEEQPARKIFAFRHHTTQEVAYETLLHSQRQQLHRAVAQALVEQQPEAVTAIAQHAFLGEAWAVALPHNLAAGEQAQRLYANQQSIAFYQKALHSAAALPEDETLDARQRIHLALGELLITTDQYEAAHTHLAEALKLAQSQGHWEAEAYCCRWYGRSYELRGEFAPALDWFSKGFAVLKPGQPSREESELALNVALIHTRQGRYAEAVELCERSLRVANQLDDAAVRARTYNTLGVVDRRRGNGQAAIERFEQSLAQYEQLQNVYGQAISHNLIANGYFMQSDWPRADFHYRRSLELFVQIGSVYNQVLGHNNLGGIARNQGRWEAALGHYQRAVRLLEQIGGSVWVLGALQMNLGQVYIKQGEVATASAHLQQAQALFEQAQVRDLLPELFGLLAEVAWHQQDWPQADAHGHQAVALARELKMPREEGHNLRVLGEIAQARGALAEARQHLDASYTILNQAGDEYESAQAQLALARWHAAQQQTEAARAILEQCTAVFARLGAEADRQAAEQLSQSLSNPTGYPAG